MVWNSLPKLPTLETYIRCWSLKALEDKGYWRINFLMEMDFLRYNTNIILFHNNSPLSSLSKMNYLLSQQPTRNLQSL